MSDMHVVRPDILDCLANLSSDEVFTPPKIVNEMLDLLPKELWSNPDARFCDPFTKSGVFLREIVKRLDKGLEKIIPDKDARIKHIFRTQVFGIAITQLTALFSRRSLYCNKDVTSERSTAQDIFTSSGGNIIFTPCKHTWVKDSCKVCGASRKALSESKEVENYAYPFLHSEAIMKNSQELGFDVVIGNPPYQMNIGVEKENYAVPIYHHFIRRAKQLNPRYLSMIVPARWYAGGRGLDDFRDEMLHDKRICEIHDFVDPSECFDGVQIKGGVCYFLWDREHQGDCKVSSHSGGKVCSVMLRPLLEDGLETFIRHNNAIDIFRKVNKKHEASFSALVSPQTPFGIISSFKNFHQEMNAGDVKFYTNANKGFIGENHILAHKEWIEEWKVYISAAYGAGEGFPHQIINKPFVGEKRSCCSQTYLLIGPFENENICNNVISYIRTRFFRFMVMLKKNAQHAMRGVYQFVPMQDFSKPWTDEELYEKYGITKEEQEFIESMIRPMKQEDDK